MIILKWILYKILLTRSITSPTLYTLLLACTPTHTHFLSERNNSCAYTHSHLTPRVNKTRSLRNTHHGTCLYTCYREYNLLPACTDRGWLSQDCGLYTCQRHVLWDYSILTLYSPVVTICTTSLTFNNSTFCPHTVFMCFVWV